MTQPIFSNKSATKKSRSIIDSFAVDKRAVDEVRSKNFRVNHFVSPEAFLCRGRCEHPKGDMEGMVTGETKFQPKSPSPPYHRRSRFAMHTFSWLKTTSDKKWVNSRLITIAFMKIVMI